MERRGHGSWVVSGPIKIAILIGRIYPKALFIYIDNSEDACMVDQKLSVDIGDVPMVNEKISDIASKN